MQNAIAAVRFRVMLTETVSSARFLLDILYGHGALLHQLPAGDRF